MSEREKRTRTNHKLPLAEYIKRHSPLKAGLEVKDEDKPLSKYNKIMNRIYVGNYQAAKDKDFFQDKKIRAVLNCTKDVPNYFAHKKDIEYMRIPVNDSLKERDFELMYNYFPCIVEYIHKHVVLQKNNILVQCHAGKQRSCIAMVAYLVAKHDLNPHEACKYMLSKRKESFHFGLSLNFEDSLMRYYKDLLKMKKIR